MHSPDRIDLVVSHNQEASVAALRIVDAVEAQGSFAWADVKAFYCPFVSAERQIARAFSRARVICLFVGDKYRNTRWCQEEYSLGLRSEQDLSIDRVITVHDGDTGRSLIPCVLANRPTFAFTDTGLQGIVEHLATLTDHSTALVKWAKSSDADRSDLLGRLPIDERTKLVVEHVEFLTRHFAMGQFEQGSEKHALRLGLIGTPNSKIPVHFDPVLLIEMAWKSTVEILGKYNIYRVISSTEHTQTQHIDAAAVMPLLRLPALFHQYLSVARDRRTPPINTESELLSVVDHVLCGFCLLYTSVGFQVKDAFRGISELLSLFEGSGPGVSRCATYLRDNLPDITFPKNSIQRQVSLYSLLRSS